MLTVCLDRELRAAGIRVFALHPGRLRTAAGAADADTDPGVAARASRTGSAPWTATRPAAPTTSWEAG